MIILYTEWK